MLHIIKMVPFHFWTNLSELTQVDQIMSNSCIFGNSNQNLELHLCVVTRRAKNLVFIFIFIGLLTYFAFLPSITKLTYTEVTLFRKSI